MDTLTRPKTPYYTEAHEAFRANLRRFVAREIAPFVDEWDEAGGFTRDLYRKAAAIGLLGLGFPEQYGGTPGDRFYSMVCLEEAVAWARQRKVFGKALIEQQVIRHKLVDMAMRIKATQAYLESLAWQIDQGDSPIADIAMVKNQATQTMAFCASEAVQIHGGMGFMRGTKVERIYREVKVNAIGGGTEEIMKELAARQLGL